MHSVAYYSVLFAVLQYEWFRIFNVLRVARENFLLKSTLCYITMYIDLWKVEIGTYSDLSTNFFCKKLI